MTTENNKITIKDKQLLLDFINSDADALTLDIDFNFLMEVVEKIKTVSNEDDFLDSLDTYNSRLSIELENQLENCFRKSYLSIEAVCNACLEFIKWYNKQKEV